jgi:hypothetical protein
MPTDKEFEDFFRDQFQGLEEAPPADGWNKIKQEIKPRSEGYKWFAISALFFAMSFTALVTTLKQENNRNLQMLTAKTQAVATPEAVRVQDKAGLAAQVKTSAEKPDAISTAVIAENSTFSSPKATVSKPGITKAVVARKKRNLPIVSALAIQNKNTAAKETGAAPAKENAAANYLRKDAPASSAPIQETVIEQSVEATTATIAAPAETEALSDTMGPMIQPVPVDRNKTIPPKKGLFRKK